MTGSEATPLTRRRFLGWTQAALASLSIGPVFASRAQAVSTTDTATPASGEDYYAKLGVEPIINAAGSYTYLTAAIMPPQVRMAVERAAHHPVRLKDLQAASGEYLAKKLRCEAALVTSGASAALTLATAACASRANGIPPEEIPQKVLTGKNEVIVQKAHRYEYDHAMALCGVTIVEVVTLDDYKRAFTDKTIMTNFFNAATGGQLSREQWLEVAHAHDVPCHMDAAADMPPIENLWKYTGMGFDLVCFSGGKGIRGPQNAGLLLGRKDLIALAGQNDSPNSDAVGRGMKVAKEQIVGMVAAIDWLLEQTNEQMQAEFMRTTEVIRKSVADLPTVKTRIVMLEVANHVPHLIIEYDPTKVGMLPKQIGAKLRAGKPSIEINPTSGSPAGSELGGENAIIIATWMMQPGDEVIVAKRLRAALQGEGV